jgi:transcriptional regulator with XRE-family HTH domain
MANQIASTIGSPKQLVCCNLILMKTMTAEQLGQRIYQMRKMRRVTQKELAERLDTHQSMVARWENAQIHPKDETVARIAEALEITVEELLNQQASAPGRRDDDLESLWGEIGILDEQDRAVLRSVLEAMILRHRMKDAMAATTGSNWRDHVAS